MRPPLRRYDLSDGLRRTPARGHPPRNATMASPPLLWRTPDDSASRRSTCRWVCSRPIARNREDRAAPSAELAARRADGIQLRPAAKHEGAEGEGRRLSRLGVPRWRLKARDRLRDALERPPRHGGGSGAQAEWVSKSTVNARTSVTSASGRSYIGAVHFPDPAAASPQAVERN